ncbi:MAG TPA: DUF6573 family protein [Chloroflexia bacterium]|nr:DUF6573 family protein [Chloroflexia bacterium]
MSLYDEIFNDTDVIASYPLEQAIEDGVLVKLFEKRWPKLTGGKPIVATHSVYIRFSDVVLRNVWNDYVYWKREVERTLPEEKRLFTTIVSGQKVWVMEDEASYCLLLPEDW